jgi:aminopeptidase N
VPEFNSGGMENVGIVTLSEDMLYRGEKKTLSNRMKLAAVVTHELAHMWFGDLVTMKWWNDLWLNEAFATYMAFFSINEIPELNFFSQMKVRELGRNQQGVMADRLSSTSPISGEVKSDYNSFTNSAISYGKGAAFLRQLHFILGNQAFKHAL